MLVWEAPLLAAVNVVRDWQMPTRVAVTSSRSTRTDPAASTLLETGDPAKLIQLFTPVTVCAILTPVAVASPELPYTTYIVCVSPTVNDGLMGLITPSTE